MNETRAYHLNRAAFFASIAIEISRQSGPSRKDEIEQYVELAKGELHQIHDGNIPVPCPF